LRVISRVEKDGSLSNTIIAQIPGLFPASSHENICCLLYLWAFWFWVLNQSSWQNVPTFSGKTTAAENMMNAILVPVWVVAVDIR
jgi:hypothetical protein